MVYFVPGLILEHLGQQLRWWDIGIKLLLFVLDGAALILNKNPFLVIWKIKKTYLENHWATSLAVFELDIIANKSFTVNQSSSDVVLLVDVLGYWHGWWVHIRILTVGWAFFRSCSFCVSICRVWFVCKVLSDPCRIIWDSRTWTFFACIFGDHSVDDLPSLLFDFVLDKHAPLWCDEQWLELIFMHFVADEFSMLTLSFSIWDLLSEW